MGERDFSFRLLANEEFIDFEAEKFNQKPYVLSFFPSGLGEKKENPIVIDNKNIILSALKKEDNGTLIRFYNSSSEKEEVTLDFEAKTSNISFTPFEVKTFVVDEIRDKRRPEPYKGKGIKYADEVIRRKVGKTGKK